MPISRRDLARYPFTKEATEYVKALDLKVDELFGPGYVKIIERAEQRIRDALISGIVDTGDPLENEVEILSFPVAVFLVVKIGDSYLKRRYALAESKRVYEMLKSDSDERVLQIATTTFGWKTRIQHGQGFLLSLFDYLRSSVEFHDDRWKLINKILVNGELLLGKEEFARLLQEEVRKHIEEVLQRNPKSVELNPPLIRVVTRISQILAQRKREIRTEELPRNADVSAYPPCLTKLYESLLSGQPLSHMARFTVTSFLLNVGMKTEDLTKLYTSLSDFNEEQTKYQVEHIAGKKGSRTKYTPPNCSTLKTHNLCSSPDDLCARIRHPLSYYRRKLRLRKRTSR